MTVHEIKCWPEFFQKIWRREKRFELRRNDRNYKLGDTLLIYEYDPSNTGNEYSGRQIRCKITYILGDKDDCEKFGLMKGFVIIGFDDNFRILPI